MNKTVEYIEQIHQELDNADTSSEVCAISNKIDDITKFVQEKFQVHEYEGEQLSEIYYALSNDKEEIEAKLIFLAEAADRCLKFIQDEEEDQKQYGSYNDQVRQTYYAGQL